MKKKTENFIDNKFKSAIADYCAFIEKGYSLKSLLKLIGDRYELNKQQRDTLARGISSEKDSINRRLKKIPELEPDTILYVDFYNIFFTILNYLNGKSLFICTDLFLRDCGGIYGKFNMESKKNKEIIDLMIFYLKELELEKVEFLLDSPISFSGELSSCINVRIKELEFNASAYTTRSPDFELKNKEKGAISTSDSIIIDNSILKVYDLAYSVLKKNYTLKIMDLNLLLSNT